MKINKNLIGVINLTVIVTVVTYFMGGFEKSEPEIEVPWTTDAVVECQEAVKNKLHGAKVKFDNAFKHRGTKEIIKGKRFQVAGKVSIGKLQKNYGCFVVYKNNKYEVEVIL
jgi:hypothetical protein